MSDGELLRRAQQGDSEAWRELYAQLLPGAWAFAMARCGKRCVAEDIVSEAFLALVRNLCRLDAESCNLRAWMHTVVRSKAVDHSRRTNAKDRALRGVHQNGQAERGGTDPVDGVLQNEQNGRVLDLLDEIREDHRLVLQLKYAENLPVREIADRMDLTVKAAESLLSRAREDFRDRYEFRERSEEMPRAVRSFEAAPGPTPGGAAP